MLLLSMAAGVGVLMVLFRLTSEDNLEFNKVSNANVKLEDDNIPRWRNNIKIFVSEGQRSCCRIEEWSKMQWRNEISQTICI